MSDIIICVVVFAILDNTVICSVNCEGLNRSRIFLSSKLKHIHVISMFTRIVTFG